MNFSQSIPGPVLPTEIWEQIAFQLEEAELQRLMGVNSLFLKLALNSRYYNVTLSQLYDNKSYRNWLLCKRMRLMLNLRRPDISRRIRELRLDPMYAYKYSIYPAEKLPIRERISTAIQGPFYRRCGPNLPSIAHDLLVNLKNLHSLYIWKPHDPEKPFISLASIIWKHQFRTLGPEGMTLRTLRLHYYAGNCLQEILQIPESGEELARYRRALGKLERLNLRIAQMRCHWVPDDQSFEELRLLAGFLRLFTAYPIDSLPAPHAFFTSNLTTFSIQIGCDGVPSSTSVKVIEDIFGALCAPSQADLSSVAQPPFPNLSRCAIVVTNTRKAPSIILDFIALQRHTITHLHISPNIVHALQVASTVAEHRQHLQPEKWDKPPVKALTRLAHLEIASTSPCQGLFSHAGINTLRSYLVQAFPDADDDGFVSGSQGITTVIIDPKSVVSYDDLHWLFYALPSSSSVRPIPYRDPAVPWTFIFQEALKRIQHLSLTLFMLTPAHLKIILSNLPSLRRLHIRIFAGAWEVPFRPSSPIDAGGNEWYSRPPLSVSLLRDSEEKDRFYAGFLEELSQLEHQRNGTGDSRNEKLVELRICLGHVKEEVLGAVEKALRGAFPGVKNIVVGNKIWIDNGIFNNS